jgi:DNA-binding LacI/PurR family transcriptional regulator
LTTVNEYVNFITFSAAHEPQSMEKKLPTIKEIAKRLNVSVSTVSRALHNHPSIGLRTKMQVQKLAQEMNYEPNQKAIFFKQGKTFTLGVIIPNLQEEFFSIAINGIEDIAIRNHYNVLISQSRDDPEREKQILETFRKYRVDGIIVSVSKNTSDYSPFEQLKDFNIPIVFFDRVPPIPGAYSVSCSLRNSTVVMVNLLVERKHTRIGFIKGPEHITFTKERLDGFREGLKKNNINEQDDLVVQTDLTTAATEKAMTILLALKPPPSAIIAFNDYVALDAIRFARRQGLKINSDVVFASYANLPITHYLDNPPFASVEQFPYEQAEKAAEMLLQLVNKKESPDIEITPQVVLEGKVMLHEDLN